MPSSQENKNLDLPQERSERVSLDVLLVTPASEVDVASNQAREERTRVCTLWPLVFCAVLANLFTNLNPVALCSFLGPVSLLVLAEKTQRLSCFMVALLPIGLALGMSLYGYLQTASLVIGILAQLLQSIAYVTHRVIVLRYSDFALATLAFPCVHTALFVLAMYCLPIGSIGNPAYSVTQLQFVSQSAALFGRNILTFLVDWAAACLARIVVAGVECPSAKRASRLCVSIWLFFIFLGALRFYSPYVLVDISNWSGASIENSHRVSCLSGSSATYESTRARLADGDTIVIHSERGTPGEVTSMLHDYTNLLQSNYAKHGTEAVVVLSFVSGQKSWYELVSRNGSLMKYAKNHPVPLVENDIVGGNMLPSVVTIPLGYPDILPYGRMVPPSSLVSLTGVICFDADFPWLTRRISGADLFLETSATWSYIGEAHFQGHKLTAIENGVTLIKCTESGVTGAFDAFGRVLFRFPQTSGIVTFIVPRFRQVVAWSGGGFVFDALMLISSVFWIGLCLAPSFYP